MLGCPFPTSPCLTTLHVCALSTWCRLRARAHSVHQAAFVRRANLETVVRLRVTCTVWYQAAFVQGNPGDWPHA